MFIYSDYQTENIMLEWYEVYCTVFFSNLGIIYLQDHFLFIYSDKNWTEDDIGMEFKATRNHKILVQQIEYQTHIQKEIIGTAVY